MDSMVDAAFPEDERRRSARTLAVALEALAFAALVGAALAWPRAAWGLVAAEVAALALCAAAGALEWRRSVRAESVALAATIVALAAGVGLVPLDLWLLAVAQGTLAIGSALLIARRFIVRDEERHRWRHAH